VEQRAAAVSRASVPSVGSSRSETASDGVEAYLTALASAEPAPGGGSAAAVAGALGAALAAMVCRVTATRDPGASALVGRAEEADTARRRLTAVAAADAHAYAAVIAARRAPAPERAAAVQAALRRATEVPVELAAEMARVLRLCADVAPSARASALGDLHVAGLLAHASLRAAVATARVNLTDVDDAEVAGAIARRLDLLDGEGGQALRRLEATLAERASRAR
jgi:formiminotetrahydrofolate cyclodeaminase